MGKHYTNTRSSLVSVAGVNFAPGATHEIPDHHADTLEKKDQDGRHTHPLRKGHAPILVPGAVQMPPAQVVPVKVLPTLETLDETRALAQVRLCDNLETLAAWHATETRPSVRDAIDTRARGLAK